MIHASRAQPVLRSNRAAEPGAPFARPRLVVARADSMPGTGEAAIDAPSTETRPDRRPHLLARFARAARLAVDEVRQSGDVPLPHLYRGRDFHRQRDAA